MKIKQKMAKLLQDNNSALKNVWKLLANADKANEVATYGMPCSITKRNG